MTLYFKLQFNVKNFFIGFRYILLLRNYGCFEKTRLQSDLRCKQEEIALFSYISLRNQIKQPLDELGNYLSISC